MKVCVIHQAFALSLEEEQASLLTLDGWFAHRKPEYRQNCFVDNVFLSICLLGATDLCNGLDVGPNEKRIQKMTESFRNHLAEEHVRQSQRGALEGDIKCDFRLIALTNVQFVWMLEAIITSMTKAIDLPHWNEHRKREMLGTAS